MKNGPKKREKGKRRKIKIKKPGKRQRNKKESIPNGVDFFDGSRDNEGSKGHALSGVRVLKFDGAIAPKVLRFDAPLACTANMI